MHHQDFQAFTLPEAVHRALVQQPPVVAVAHDALHRLERRHLFRRLQSPAEIPGMPNLIDILQELLELGAEHAVTVRYEADVHYS